MDISTLNSHASPTDHAVSESILRVEQCKPVALGYDNIHAEVLWNSVCYMLHYIITNWYWSLIGCYWHTPPDTDHWLDVTDTPLLILIIDWMLLTHPSSYWSLIECYWHTPPDTDHWLAVTNTPLQILIIDWMLLTHPSWYWSLIGCYWHTPPK
jgi:hypothetical protein